MTGERAAHSTEAHLALVPDPALGTADVAHHVPLRLATWGLGCLAVTLALPLRHGPSGGVVARDPLLGLCEPKEDPVRLALRTRPPMPRALPWRRGVRGLRLPGGGGGLLLRAVRPPQVGYALTR